MQADIVTYLLGCLNRTIIKRKENKSGMPSTVANNILLLNYFFYFLFFWLNVAKLTTFTTTNCGCHSTGPSYTLNCQKESHNSKAKHTLKIIF